jgi:cytoskeleton protein RodZ
MPFDLCRIGQLLRSAREDTGLTYEEVSTALFIRKRVIEAIETGNWETLPHPVYVRGYVTQYASFLKVQDAVEAAMMPSAPEATVVQTEETAPLPRTERKKKASWRMREPKKKIVGAAIMGAVVVGFFVFQNLPKPAYVIPPARTVENAPRAALATPTAASTAPASETTNPYQTVETSASGPVDVSPGQPAGPAPYDKQEERLVLETKKLTIACQDRTWVRIIIDGTETKEFTLNPEEVVMLNAKDRFDILVGNAAGVKLIYNGRDVGLTGQAGEVKHINLS